MRSKNVSDNQQLDFPSKTSCFFFRLSPLRTGNVPCPIFPVVVFNPPRAAGRAAFGFVWMGSMSPVQVGDGTAAAIKGGTS